MAIPGNFTKNQNEDTILRIPKKTLAERVRSYIESGGNVNDNSGLSSPLISVIGCGKNPEVVESVRFLLERGATADKTANGLIPVIESIKNGNDPEVLKLLVEYGADIDIQDDNGDTPLLYAIGQQNMNMASACLSLGADPNIRNNRRESCIEKALPSFGLESGMKMIELLVRHGAREDGKRCIGQPIIVLSTTLSGVGRIDDLLKMGFNIDQRDVIGRTALFHAIESRSISNIEFLISRGANINARDDFGLTPLAIAVVNREPDIARFLVRRGADVNAKSNDGNTILMESIAFCRSGITEFLLDSGANASAENDSGMTALNILFESTRSFPDVVRFAKLLVSHGAELVKKNSTTKETLDKMSGSKRAMLTLRYFSSEILRDSNVTYSDVPLSDIIPKNNEMNVPSYAEMLRDAIPAYLDRAVRDPAFGAEMERNVADILARKDIAPSYPIWNTKPFVDCLTRKDVALLEKILKTLRSIDYTDRIKQKEIFQTYDMEL